MYIPPNIFHPPVNAVHVLSFASICYGNSDFINQRPCAVAGVSQYAVNKGVEQWLNPAAFSMPAPGTFGNLGRGTFVGPSFQQIDFSVLKDFAMSDNSRLQFRAELFNVLNHPNLAEPDTIFGNPTFGKMLSTLGNTIGVGTSRQIQLSLRFVF